MYPIYQQSLPPGAYSSTIVSAWACLVAQAHRPTMADRMDVVVRDLVAHVVRDTSPHRRLHVELEVTRDGLRITLRVPGQDAHAGALECTEMADASTSMGCSGGPAGREAWAEFRPEDVATVAAVVA